MKVTDQLQALATFVLGTQRSGGWSHLTAGLGTVKKHVGGQPGMTCLGKTMHVYTHTHTLITGTILNFAPLG